MENKVLAIVGLRAAALALALIGNTAAANILYTLANAAEAGQATDEHLALVAAKLKERDLTAADWADVGARIEADSKRLQDS